MLHRVFIGTPLFLSLAFGELEAKPLIPALANKKSSQQQAAQQTGAPIQGTMVDYCGDGPSPMQATLRHIEAKGVGYGTGYSTLELFFTSPRLWVEELTPFLDLRGHIFDNGRLAANAGLGIRYLAARIWGANIYYDYRQTHHHQYNQVSAGIETLGELLDFRLLGYFPVGSTTSSYYDPTFSHFSGNSLYINQKRQFAYISANAEMGCSLNFFESMPLYFAGGVYYLHGKGSYAVGGELRANITFADCFKLEASGSYDHIFKWIGQGQFGLSVPFGRKPKVRARKEKSCKTELALLRKAAAPSDRNEIIPVGTETQLSAAINPLTGLPYFFVFVSSFGNSNSQWQNPWRFLAQALAQSKPLGSILYLSKGDGSPYAGGYTMEPYERVLGSGVGIVLAVPAGNLFLPPTTDGNPLVEVPTSAVGFEMNQNTSVEGVDFILGVAAIAVHAEDVENVGFSKGRIEFTETDGIGAFFEGVTNVEVSNLEFSVQADSCVGTRLERARNSRIEDCNYNSSPTVFNTVYQDYEECEGTVVNCNNHYEMPLDSSNTGVKVAGTSDDVEYSFYDGEFYSTDSDLNTQASAFLLGDGSDFKGLSFSLSNISFYRIGTLVAGTPLQLGSGLWFQIFTFQNNRFYTCASPYGYVVDLGIINNPRSFVTVRGNTWVLSLDRTIPSLRVTFLNLSYKQLFLEQNRSDVESGPSYVIQDYEGAQGDIVIEGNIGEVEEVSISPT